MSYVSKKQTPLSTYEVVFGTTEAFVIYIDPDSGSDANDGTAGNAVASWDRVQQLIPRKIDHLVQVQCTDSVNYPAFGTWAGYLGGGELRILGNTTTPANVSIALTGANDAGLFQNNSCIFSVYGVTLDGDDTGSTEGLQIENCTDAYLFKVTIQDFDKGIYGRFSSSIRIDQCDITSNASYGVHLDYGSKLTEIDTTSSVDNGVAYKLQQGSEVTQSGLSSYSGITGASANEIDEDCRITSDDGTEVVGTITKFHYNEDLADEGTVTIPDASSQFVLVDFDDGAEWAFASVTSAGAVTLIANSSANVVNTDTDAKYCIYDSGTGATVKNRIGATKNVKIVTFS